MSTYFGPRCTVCGQGMLGAAHICGGTPTFSVYEQQFPELQAHLRDAITRYDKAEAERDAAVAELARLRADAWDEGFKAAVRQGAEIQRWNDSEGAIVPSDIRNPYRALLAEPSQPDTEEPDGRDPACVEKWPEAESFKYDPRCCRFPKNCSAGYR